MAIIRALLRPFPLALSVDAALFQHGGWYITQGAVPYIDIWDPTPPLSFFLPALLAALTGGDMLALHLFSIILTGLVAITFILVVGYLTVEITAVPWTGLVAGYLMLTFVSFYILPTLGFQFKHYAILAGLLGILFALHDQPLLAGIFAAASLYFWLTDVIFPLLVLGIVWQRLDWRAMLKAAAGMVLIGLLVLLPIVVWGAFEAMVREVIIAPLLAPEDQSLIERLEKGVRILMFTSPLFVIAPLAIFARLRHQRLLWWLVAGGAYFAAQLLFLDFDSSPDLIAELAFVAIGTGIFAAQVAPRWRTALVLLLFSALFLNPVMRFMAPETGNPAAKLEEAREFQIYVLPSMQAMYWNKVKPETCHYRLSGTEKAWIIRMRELGQEDCPSVWQPAIGR